MTAPTAPGSPHPAEQLLRVLAECFHGAEETGAFLDPGANGLIQVLARFSAAEASRPVAGSSIATHCLHLAFSLDAFHDYIAGRRDIAYDWATSWAKGTVNEADWRALLERLDRQHEELARAIREVPPEPEVLWAAAGLLAHTAFHLGAIQVKADELIAPTD